MTTPSRPGARGGARAIEEEVLTPGPRSAPWSTTLTHSYHRRETSHSTVPPSPSLANSARAAPVRGHRAHRSLGRSLDLPPGGPLGKPLGHAGVGSTVRASEGGSDEFNSVPSRLGSAYDTSRDPQVVTPS